MDPIDEFYGVPARHSKRRSRHQKMHSVAVFLISNSYEGSVCCIFRNEFHSILILVSKNVRSSPNTECVSGGCGTKRPKHGCTEE